MFHGRGCRSPPSCVVDPGSYETCPYHCTHPAIYGISLKKEEFRNSTGAFYMKCKIKQASDLNKRMYYRGVADKWGSLG